MLAIGYVRRIEPDLWRDVLPWIGARPTAELMAPGLLAATVREITFT